MRHVLLLTACVSVVGSNSLALSPMSPAVAADFGGVSAADVMIGSAAYGLAVTLSALLLAPSVDRIGPARVLTFAMAGLAVALAASALAPNLWLLAAAQAGAGIAAGAALPSTYALCAQISEKGRESETLGWVLTGWTISMVGGVAAAAAIAETVDWRAVYAALALIAALIVAALIRRRARDPAWRAERVAAAGAPSPFAVFDGLRAPGAPATLAVVAAYMVAFYGVYSFVGAHTTEAFGRGAAWAGVVALCYGLGFGAAAPIDRVFDKVSLAAASRVIFIGLTATYGLIAAAAGDPVALLAATAIWGLVNHLALNLLVGRLSALDPARRGAVLGLYSATTYLSMFIGAAGFKPIFEAGGLAAAALAAGALFGAAALAWMATYRAAGRLGT